MMPAIAAQQAWGFSLLGPSDGPDATWQIPAWGYNVAGDVGAPKAIGQGYRRNTPYIFYGYSQSFYDFFYTNGEAAVDGAFATYNALTNADNLQLSQFPFDSLQSFDARALDLIDLKSITMAEIMEQLGLTAPVRYVWTLHDRFLPGGAVCSQDPNVNGEEYTIVQRNIDPISQVYSTYVNDVLYDYEIFESCGNADFFPEPVSTALAYTYPVDLNALPYTPLTEEFDAWHGSFGRGNYYTGLTYDDAGALRYLYSTNNLNVEAPVPGSLLEATNTSQLQFLETSNLYTLMQFAQTNPPTAVEAEFPDIVIDNVSTQYNLVEIPNVYSYFTNYPGSPASVPPVLVVGTNGFTPSIQTDYIYSFGNVVTVNYHTNTPAYLTTISLSEVPGSPASDPLIKTNVTTKKVILKNVISGDYYLIPPGSCGFEIVKTVLKNHYSGTVTNVITTTTNTSTINPGFVGSESIVTRFTNNWFEYYACNFTNPAPALYQGVGKVNFIRADYDSTLGQFFNPVTNNFSMVTVVGSKPITQYFQRIVTAPDILIDAKDLASPANNVPPIGVSTFSRGMSYTEDPQVPGAGPASGPGTISDYDTTISFNDAGNVYGVLGADVNATNAFLATEPSLFTWGSFDNSTNAPIVYPVGSNLQNLLVQLTPSPLPDAVLNSAYSQQFGITGGDFTPPYTWSLGIDPVTLVQTSLPNGLTLSSTGALSGTPAIGDATGPYDFILQMTDNNGRSVTWNLTINVDPIGTP